MKLSESARKALISLQKREITEHFVYKELAKLEKNRSNRRILLRIAGEELKHYNTWKRYTGEEVAPSRLEILKHMMISRIFGITFGLKMMEGSTEKFGSRYRAVSESIPGAASLLRSGAAHEKDILKMINEERLRYASSIVLGLNDALVELTGTLAGFTLALQNTSLIAVAGLITGIAASLSMAASEYLSSKSSDGADGKNPLKSSLYTGAAYVLTVTLLILPYFIFSNVYLSLAGTLANAMVVILIFTFYISVAKEIPFRRRFSEMALISFGIAAITFAIGYMIRAFLGVNF